MNNLSICDKYQSCEDRCLCLYAIPHEPTQVDKCPLRNVHHLHQIVPIVNNVVIK